MNPLHQYKPTMEKILRILIVEDQESDAEILKRIIAREGIKFVDKIIDTKAEFIDALSSFSPDLILSDYSLPQFNGMKALLLRQQMAPNVPFLLVTGSNNEEVAVECMKAGADDYIIKQNLIRLVPAIRAALQKKESIRLRRETEEALVILKKAVDNSGEIIFMTDKEGIFSFVNPAFTAVYGFTPEEVVGKLSPRILESGLMEANNYKLFWETLLGGKEVKGDLINKTKDGTMIYIESTSTPILDENKDIVGFLGIQSDITERIRATEEIRRERMMLRAIIDNIPDTVYVKDAQCRKIIANPADLEIIGCASEAEVIGKTDLDIFPGETGIHGHADDLKVLQTGEPVIYHEDDFIDRNGAHRWLLTSKIPLFNEQGVVAGLVGIGHDITARKHIEAEIRKKIEELAISNEELSRFNRLAIGREMRMIEIKKYCNLLAAKLGMALPYPLSFLQDNQKISDVDALPPDRDEGERKENKA